jgi:transcriptional regulator with PAS, ATPase and Fis domain
MNLSQKSLLMLLVWLVLSGFTVVYAQEPIVNDEKSPNAASESGDTVATSENNAEPTVIDSIESVKAVSQSLKDRFDGVMEALKNSQNSEETAERELNTVSELANEAVSLFDEDSEVWTYTNQLIETYTADARYAEGKAEQLPVNSPFAKPWREVAEEWHQKKAAIKKIQAELRNLRKKNQKLLDELPLRKELLIQFIKLGMAEKALAQLKLVVNDMQTMQNGLTNIIGGIEKVSPGKAPQ